MKLNKLLLLIVMILLSSVAYAEYSIIGSENIDLVSYSGSKLNYDISYNFTGTLTMTVYTNTINDFSLVSPFAIVDCIEGETNCAATWLNLNENETVYYKVVFNDGEEDEKNVTGSFTSLELFDFSIDSITIDSADLSFKSNQPLDLEVRYKKQGSNTINKIRASGDRLFDVTLENLSAGIKYESWIYIDGVTYDAYDSSFTSKSVGDITIFDVTTLTDGMVTRNDSVIVAGITHQGISVKVYNNNPLAVYGTSNESTGGFLLNLPLKCTGNGINNVVVVVTQTEPYFATASKNYTIICDQSEPVLEIDTGSKYHKSTDINISFRVFEDVILQIWHNKTDGNRSIGYDDGTYKVELAENRSDAFVNLTVNVMGGVTGNIGNAITGNAVYGIDEEQGEYTFHFKVTDMAGNSRTYDKTVIVDNQPPWLDVEVETDVTSSVLIIKGEAEPGSTVTITNLENMSEFHYNVEDGNYYKCIEKDGNDVACTDQPIQSVKVSSNLLGQAVKFVGEAIPFFSESVDVGSDGEFIKTIHLVEGTNRIAFSLKDEAGNVVSVDENFEFCQINGASGCSIEVEMKGSNDHWFVKDYEAFPNIVYYDLLSSDDVTRRAGTINVVLSSRSFLDMSRVHINSVSAKIKKDEGNMINGARTMHFFDGTNWIVVISFDFAKQELSQDDLRTMIKEWYGTADNINFEVELNLDYSLLDQYDEDMSDDDPIIIPVSINVQKPDFINFLSEDSINNIINFINKSQKVTKRAEEISLGVSKVTLGVCAGLTAKIYVQAALGDVDPQDYEKMYKYCDRVACPYVPPNCKEKASGFEANDHNGRIDGYQDDNFELFYYEGKKDCSEEDKKEYDDLRSQYLEENEKIDADDELINSLKEKMDGYSCKLFTTYADDFHENLCRKCGSGKNCIVRETVNTGVTGEMVEDGWSSSTTNGVLYRCDDKGNTIEDWKDDLTEGEASIATSCYKAGAPSYHEYSCIVNRKSGNDPKKSNLNPADDIFTSTVCGCTTGFYQHMRNINILLDNVKQCLEGVKYGDFDAGYCRELVSQYACDWFYRAIKKFGSGDSVFSKNPSKSQTEGYAAKNIDNVNDALEDRYSDTIVDPSTGFNKKGLAYSACTWAFGGDFEFFDNALEEIVQAKDVEPMIPPPIAYSRILAPNYLTGELGIFYHVSYEVYSGGQDIEWEVEFYCDNAGKEDPEYCMPSYSGFGNPIVKKSGVVKEGEDYQDTFETTEFSSQGWANKVRLTAKYMIDGEYRTKTFDRDVKHYGSIPAGCEFSAQPFANNRPFRCDILPSDSVGGTVRLKSAKESPETRFYPEDEVNIIMSFENKMYNQDSFILKYKLDGPAGFNDLEGEKMYTLVEMDKLDAGMADLNWHLFSLKNSGLEQYKTLSYNDGSFGHIKENSNSESVSANFERLMNQVRNTEGVFYVTVQGYDFKSVQVLSDTVKDSDIVVSDGSKYSQLQSAIERKDDDDSDNFKPEITVVLTDVNGANKDLTLKYDSALGIYDFAIDSDMKIGNIDFESGYKFSDLNENVIVDKEESKLNVADEVIINGIRFIYDANNGLDATLQEPVTIYDGDSSIVCDEVPSSTYYRCKVPIDGKFVISEIVADVLNPSGEVVFKVVTNYNNPETSTVFTYTYLTSDGALPTDYPAGDYTLYVSMYRDIIGEIGFDSSDVLLPYGPKNQSEIIKFDIVANKGEDSKVSSDIVFPPTRNIMSCDKDKGLVVGMNLNNMIPDVSARITLTGRNMEKQFEGKIDISKNENIKDEFNINLGNFVFKLKDDAFNGLQPNDEAGSIRVKVNLIDDDNKKILTESSTVYMVDEYGYDCSMNSKDYLGKVVTLEYVDDGTIIEEDEDEPLPNDVCVEIGGSRDDDDDYVFDVCLDNPIFEKNYPDFCGECYLKTCGDDDKGYYLLGSSKKSIDICDALGKSLENNCCNSKSFEGWNP